jgi:uncharacterized protein (DUF952 family)
VQLDADKLGDGLKWEPFRGGAQFPRLYGELDLAAVLGIEPLPLAVDGSYKFPSLEI